MALTAGQTRLFFEHASQMGIPHETVVQLQKEGIKSVSDLTDFDKETFDQISANLRRPTGRINDPNPTAAPGSTIPTPPFVFGAKSQKRLIVAAKLIKYYETVGRPLTADNIQWTSVMKNFDDQKKALENKVKNDEPDVPKISKALPVIKWTEAFKDYLHRIIGVREIPLAYIIRPEATVQPIGEISDDSPHSQEHGAIELELIARASHTHALFREDNSTLYYKVEEATRGTAYGASIKPYQRNKDGRGAWIALSTQYAGVDKWEAEIKRNEQLMHTRVWKGQSNFTLERFVAQHRHAFVSMEAAAEHVTYQLPNAHSRVGYLLDAIQCNDAGLQAAMANIKTDQQQNGMKNDFELAATNLLPYDPVQKKRTQGVAGDKRSAADISDITADETADVNAFGAKKGIGKSGVHLRYHNFQDYKRLNEEQKDELRAWRETTGSKGKRGRPDTVDKRNNSTSKKTKFDNEKAIASAVEKKVAEKMKALKKAKSDDDKTESYIMSIIKKAAQGSKAVKIGDTTAITPSLQSIIKRARNGGENN